MRRSSLRASASPPPTIASSRSRPRPPRRFFFGPSLRATEASRRASPAFLTSFWKRLSSVTTFAGGLAVADPARRRSGRTGRRPSGCRAAPRPGRGAGRRGSSRRPGRPTGPSPPSCSKPCSSFTSVGSGLGGAYTRSRPGPRTPGAGRPPGPARAPASRTSRTCSTKTKSRSRAQVLGHLVDVGLVAPRARRRRPDAVALRGQRLLLQAADRQHLAAERDLAGHRDVVAHRRPVSSETSAVAIVTPALGPSFGDRARRARGRGCRGRRTSSGSRPGATSSRCARTKDSAACADSFMTSPSWPVSDELALARHRRGLDEEDVAADRRPGQAGGHAGLARPAPRLGREAALAEQLARTRGLVDRHALGPGAVAPRPPAARPCGTRSRSRARAGARRPRACSRAMITRSAAVGERDPATSSARCARSGAGTR